LDFTGPDQRHTEPLILFRTTNNKAWDTDRQSRLGEGGAGRFLRWNSDCSAGAYASKETRSGKYGTAHIGVCLNRGIRASGAARVNARRL